MKRILLYIFSLILRPYVLFTRWVNHQIVLLNNRELKRKLQIKNPDTVKLYGHISIGHPENCFIEEGTSIHDANWDARGTIKIGKYVHFGARVTILTSSHNYLGDEIPYDCTHIEKPVIIEDFSWIGSDVIIAPGTYIEEGCIVGMGTTVSGRVAKGSIIGGPKWHVLKQRDLDKFEELKQAKKFH